MKSPTKNRRTVLRRVHYVLSTHWDREWHRTFQGFRRQLVQLLDRTLEGLKSGRLNPPFTTDGQAIILEDYLEIRPDRRRQVEQYVAAGKFKVGPWYVLPDEWLVSGESLIRNLRLGRQIARDFGAAPSQAGFVCDLFGHNSQMPQIFKGFGINVGFLWRGVEQRPSAHFLWEGADGSQLLTYRFGRNGYCDFAFDVRHVPEHAIAFDRDRALADTKAFLDKEAFRTTVPPMLLFDGGDHLEYDEDYYALIAGLKPVPDFPYEIVYSSLDDYMKELLGHADSVHEVIRGELRETGKPSATTDVQWLIPGVLSSRIWIKQANAECQTLLSHWAEPFASMASTFLEVKYPAGYLDVAWKWLLQNHPHDSICGCSIDEVHEDMKYRFAQCRQLASDQTDESLRLLAASVQGSIGENELRVLVANPLPSQLDEPVKLTLRLPGEWSFYQEFFNFEPKVAFRIFDDSGVEVPYQLVAQDMGRSKVLVHPLKFPEILKANDVIVVVRLSLPPLGYTTLTVREGERASEKGPFLPTRHAQSPGLATSDCSMENEFLAVTIEPNGTLTIRDARTGQTYRRLLTFEDTADIGDGWYHGPAVNDQKFVSLAAPTEIALVSDGKLFCQFRVRTEMRLPQEFNFERKIRSETFGKIILDSLITLRAGCDRVEVCTTVDNRCADHRLRVLFPTGTKASHYLADSVFDVVERKIGLPADHHLDRELTVEAAPQQTWTAVTSGKRGLAVVAFGLPESAVYDLPERPLALTLFRATRKTVFTDGQPEGQLQGKMTFHYWIVPLPGTVDRRQLCDYGTQIGAGIRTAQLRKSEIDFHRRGKGLPPSASFVEVTGGAVLTSVRHMGDALEIRLFNPETKKLKTSVNLSKASKSKGNSFHKMTLVDLESRPLGKSQMINSGCKISLNPKQIVTLQFT